MCTRAAMKGHANIVKLFLDHESVTDKNPLDNNGKTPLNRALFFKNVKVIDIFKNYGITLDENPPPEEEGEIINVPNVIQLSRKSII